MVLLHLPDRGGRGVFVAASAAAVSVVVVGVGLVASYNSRKRLHKSNRTNDGHNAASSSTPGDKSVVPLSMIQKMFMHSQNNPTKLNTQKSRSTNFII